MNRNMKMMRLKLKNIEEIEEKDPDESSQSTNNASSFTTTLHILCNETYHLKDAFPELCKVYGAIPISSLWYPDHCVVINNKVS